MQIIAPFQSTNLKNNWRQDFIEPIPIYHACDAWDIRAKGKSRTYGNK